MLIFSKQKIQKNSGMTMLELLVVAAVVAVVSAITIGSFPLGNARSYVKVEAERLALDLRRVQNYAINGRVGPDNLTTPINWAIRIRERGNQTDDIVIYADANNNCGINNGEDIETYFLENKVDISELTSATDGAENELNFCFSVPHGDLRVYDNNSNVGSFGTIRLLRASSNQNVYRDIQMRVSGQIVITGN